MIDVSDLSFAYRGASSNTLQGLSFSVAEGEIFGCLGPSGAGKSTTQKILIRLLQGYAGSAEVFGREVRSWDKSLYERIGVSFELPNHYAKLTAEENLSHFKALYQNVGHSPQQVLEWVGLGAEAATRAGEMSKGMKIRLNVARAVIHGPRLLFLDEPTSGLDPVNARRIRDMILALREAGTTVFLTTHNMLLAEQLCDRVAFMTDGSIAVIDAPDSLKQLYGQRKVALTLEGEAVQHFDLDGLGENPAFLAALNSGKPIHSLHSEESTLDDIFIQVTGHSLSSGDDA